MKKQINELLNKVLFKFGIELLRFPNGILKKRIQLLNKFRIDLILDVGANTGQYARLTRKIGYKGEIVSFEPVSKAFLLLDSHSKNDKKWTAVRLGLGDIDNEVLINVSQNLVSSSILDMNAEHIKAAPDSKYVTQEKITVKKLDSIFDQYCGRGKNVFLKIDTQGFEKQVIDGAIHSLDKITGIQVEMSLVQLYEGESKYDDLKKLIESYGFDLYSLEPGFSDPNSGKLMQIDGIFFKKINLK